MTSPRLVAAIAALVLASPLAAADAAGPKDKHGRPILVDRQTEVRTGDGVRETDRTTTVADADGTTKRQQRDHERVARQGGTTTWQRTSDGKGANGSSTHVEAQGSATRTGQGAGAWEASRQGRAVDAKGREHTWTAEAEGSWKANGQGGRDSERHVERTDGQGRTTTTDAERRSAAKGNQKAWVEQAVRTLPDGETVKTWGEGRTIRHKLKDGYAEERISRGDGDRGGKWHREEQVRVVYHDDGRREVRRIEAIKREGKPTFFTESTGTWTRSGDRTWTYAGEQTTRENGKVIETRKITETKRHLPMPEQLADVTDEG